MKALPINIINRGKSLGQRLLVPALLLGSTILAKADAMDDAEAAIPAASSLAGMTTAIFAIVGAFVLIKLGKRGANKV